MSREEIIKRGHICLDSDSEKSIKKHSIELCINVSPSGHFLLCNWRGRILHQTYDLDELMGKLEEETKIILKWFAVNIIRHWVTDGRYLCNRACNITEEKVADYPYEVTCKNCLRELKKENEE